ncbi:hypothetical protein [Mangrovitalea sediminis]|uniref:hypothetical protein n=1 Tax=Mangrovitalea sediminis TaxID=1982043 RepID=UPI001177A321|nr:hypothetical protein [Mangrovitalea sediminis]
MSIFRKAIGLGAAAWLATSFAPAVSAGVIFQDNFDNQPDYIADNYLSGSNHELWASRGDTVPKGWDAVSVWSLFAGKSGLQITSANSDKARGGTGKSLVILRGSGSTAWSSDAELAKNFSPGYDQLYVSFWIKFQPGWTPDGHTKIFRIGSYAPDTIGPDYWSNIGMGFIWDWVSYPTGSGLRNGLFLAPKPGAHFSNPNIGNGGCNYDGYNTYNANYTNCPYDLNADGVVDNKPQILDRVSGGIIPDGGVATHDMVFGSAWNHMEFFVKVNSKPGVQDGILKEWFNGSLIFENDAIPWRQADMSASQNFTAIKFGGNDFFTTYPRSDEHTEWYSIDDVVVRDDLPANRLGNAPNPPSNVSVK